MIKTAFSHVTDWVFDLDHTLYPPTNTLFSQIEEKMNSYVMSHLNVDTRHASALRDHYWQFYGTTLAGLMREHDIDPVPFLDQVHDIDFSVLRENAPLREAISALPGRKIIYTNGTAPYAEKVLDALGLTQEFSDLYGVEHAQFLPKPERKAFEVVFDLAKIAPHTAAMFEDSVANLRVPSQMGLKTVLVHTQGADADKHIDFQTDNLTNFLRQIV